MPLRSMEGSSPRLQQLENRLTSSGRPQFPERWASQGWRMPSVRPRSRWLWRRGRQDRPYGLRCGAAFLRPAAVAVHDANGGPGSRNEAGKVRTWTSNNLSVTIKDRREKGNGALNPSMVCIRPFMLEMAWAGHSAGEPLNGYSFKGKLSNKSSLRREPIRRSHQPKTLE